MHVTPNFMTKTLLCSNLHIWNLIIIGNSFVLRLHLLIKSVCYIHRFARDHLYTGKNILISFLIVVTSRLDDRNDLKNVLQLMEIRLSMVIKRLSLMDNTTCMTQQNNQDGETWHLLALIRKEFGILMENYVLKICQYYFVC